MKRIFLFLFITVCAIALQAQVASNFPGFTFRWSGGYAGAPVGQGIPAPVINTLTPDIDQFGNLANINAPNGSNKMIKTSYGQGLDIGLRFGYMFNQYIGVDMGMFYAQSKTISAYQQTILYQPDSAGNAAPSGAYLDNQITTVSHSVVLSPSVLFAYAKPKFKFYPYLRLGVALPVYTQITNKLNLTLDGLGASNTTYNSPYFLGDITTVTMQTVTQFTVGFNGSVGVVYRPANFINLFVELNGQYLNMKGQYTKVTEWDADGYDLTPNRGVYRERTNYVKSVSSQSNNAQYNANYNPNLPKQDVSPVFPFSNIGFNLGVQLVLSKKVFKDQDGFDQDRSKKVKKAKKTTDDQTKPAQ